MTYILYRSSNPIMIIRSKQSIPQLERFIRETSADSAKIIFTAHAEQRMRQRNITKKMVIETLRNGKIHRAPEPNPARGSLECKMEHFCAGHHIGVIVAVMDEDPSLIVVTAM